MRVEKWSCVMLAAVAALLAMQAASGADLCSARPRQANLDFTLHDIGGHEIAPRELRGAVVLINFWATWCAPCRTEIPDLVVLYEKYRERGLMILGVSVDDPLPRLLPFVTELGVTYPVLLGTRHREFVDAFGPLAGFPTSLLISREGKVCARHVGAVDSAELERQVRSLL